MNRQRIISLRTDIDLPEMQANLSRTKPLDSETRSWYSIRNLSRDEAEVLIYDEVGHFGVSASDFIRDLQDIKASKINLRVNSPGGEVFDGVSIYNAIKRHTAEVTVYVDGLAASIASVIAMAGDRVLMSPHAQMMIHEASGLAMGNAADMRKLADILDGLSNTIAGVYSDRTGKPLDEWRAAMKEETWYSDEEAVAAGLADAIVGKEDAPKAIRNAVVEPVDAPTPEVVPTPEPQPSPIDWRHVVEEASKEAEEAYF